MSVNARSNILSGVWGRTTSHGAETVFSRIDTHASLGTSSLSPVSLRGNGASCVVAYVRLIMYSSCEHLCKDGWRPADGDNCLVGRAVENEKARRGPYQR